MHIKKIKLIFILLFFCITYIYSKNFPETIIKVAILIDVNNVNISCEDEYFLYNMQTGEIVELDHKNNILVEINKSGILLNNTQINTNFIRLVSKKDNCFIYINGKRYRDSILIKKNKNNKITVINELGLEGYLYGILPREVDDGWKIEALKAQAVISRTYAVNNLTKHEKDGFNFCNTVHCQVYSGVESEKPETNKAVNLTKGEILTYNGKTVNSLYHACCGGHTENPKYIWNSYNDPPEYLNGVVCKYCKNSPHYSWTKTIDENLILEKLHKYGYKQIKKIKKIFVSDKTPSNRYRYIKIKYISSNDDNNILTFPADRFRLIIDPWLIKSTKIKSIIKQDTKFQFSGYGWGHGVGLCQWGAKVMADEGYNYKQILKYYYPNTDIQKYEY